MAVRHRRTARHRSGMPDSPVHRRAVTRADGLPGGNGRARRRGCGGGGAARGLPRPVQRPARRAGGAPAAEMCLRK